MFFLNLTQDQVNNLASGFFGIYTRQDTTSQTRENIHRLLPPLWSQVDEITRQQFGVKYGKFVANNDQKEASFAKQFLESASALAYIPDTLRAAEMGIALDNLLTAHRGFNNFYNEPPFARELQRLVSHQRSVPSQIEDSYVLGLVEAFLGNGNGIAFFANDIYRSMIDQFDSSQALKAVLSFSSDNISSRLQFPLCEEKFLELLEMMKLKIPAAAGRELIADIEAYSGPFEKMRGDTRIKRKIDNLKTILG
jgi:hypothetical protein